jgi:fatty-acyl-CoA synthase
VVAQHPAVTDCTVVGRPDPVWGQVVVAVVALAPGATLDTAALGGFCAGKLSRYKIPREVVVTTDFVRGPAGKADYAWARRLASGG